MIKKIRILKVKGYAGLEEGETYKMDTDRGIMVGESGVTFTTYGIIGPRGELDHFQYDYSSDAIWHLKVEEVVANSNVVEKSRYKIFRVIDTKGWENIKTRDIMIVDTKDCIVITHERPNRGCMMSKGVLVGNLLINLGNTVDQFVAVEEIK